jgi:7-cyano-7-deazaguanine synthase
MDSATAMFWAAERYDIAAIMHFDYGQRGMEHEQFAALMLLGSLKVLDKVSPYLNVLSVSLRIPAGSSLTSMGISLDPAVRDRYGHPMTFVPGRNLIFISYATAVAYDTGSRHIVGGWSDVDVDYPDCSSLFLSAANEAARFAIGRKRSDLNIESPLMHKSKAEIVRMGVELCVPWKHTRSCYDDKPQPCGDCQSCQLRAEAFRDVGITDPLME